MNKTFSKFKVVPASKFDEISSQKGGNLLTNPETTSQEKVNIPKKVKVNREKDEIYKDLVSDRDARIIEIIMRLALINGFSIDNFNLKDKYGNVIPSTNIIQLIKYAQLPQKFVYGESEFVNLLHQAGVSKNLIVNQYIKKRLEELEKGNVKKASIEKINELLEDPIENLMEVQPYKRKREDSDEEYEQEIKKIKMPKLTPKPNWVYPDQE